MSMIITYQLIIALTVLVTNQNENVGDGSFPGFDLGEELVDIMIAEKRNGAFEQYFFVINNLIKHADAKAYNRHVATGMMMPGELFLFGQEVLGLLLLENYWGPWEQLVNALQRGETDPGNEVVQTKYTNPGNKRNPWRKEGLEWYNVLHDEVRKDQLSSAGQIFETEFKKWMLAKAGKAMSRKRKAVPFIEVAAVHELDSDSDEDDGSGGQGTGATSTVSNLSDSQGGIECV
jgi:hypothetical protein